WDMKRTSGGSSGGSAAAVAAGPCLPPVGTGKGGSIPVPPPLFRLRRVEAAHRAPGVARVGAVAWWLHPAGALGPPHRRGRIAAGRHDRPSIFARDARPDWPATRHHGSPWRGPLSPAGGA